eukprot:3539236-Rhodomonas_salina.2
MQIVAPYAVSTGLGLACAYADKSGPYAVSSTLFCEAGAEADRKNAEGEGGSLPRSEGGSSARRHRRDASEAAEEESERGGERGRGLSLIHISEPTRPRLI